MGLDLITRAATLIAVLGSAVVYGTDVFCAIVLRPALALVDDRALAGLDGHRQRCKAGDLLTPPLPAFQRMRKTKLGHNLTGSINDHGVMVILRPVNCAKVSESRFQMHAKVHVKGSEDVSCGIRLGLCP